jgi:hypothetical protein
MTTIDETARAGLIPRERDYVNPEIQRIHDAYLESPEREEARRLQEERLVGAAEIMNHVVGYEPKGKYRFRRRR